MFPIGIVALLVGSTATQEDVVVAQQCSGQFKSSSLSTTQFQSVPSSSVCKENDQNILLQSKYQVSMNQEMTPDEILDALVKDDAEDAEATVAKESQDKHPGARGAAKTPRDSVPLTSMYTHEGPESQRDIEPDSTYQGTPLSRAKSEDPPDTLLLKLDKSLQNFMENVETPKGWFLLPSVAFLFLLLLQCTDVHADSYGMEEQNEGSVQPPPCPDRMPSWDVVRFALLLSMIWAQFLRAFGSQDAAFQVQELVWPAWFFVAGIFGSGCTYESLSKTICYCFVTNFFLTFLSLFFAFFNYRGAMELNITGSWMLWDLMIFRTTLTPAFHAMKALRLPAPCFVILVLVSCFGVRLRTLSPISGGIGNPSIEALLLMVGSTEATIQSAVLHAPYFAVGLLLKPAAWNALFRGTWTSATITVIAVLSLSLAATPLPCWLRQWRCSDDSWGTRLELHALHVGGFREDMQLYFVRMGCMVSLVFSTFTVATFIGRCTPALHHNLARCGSRARFSLAVFILWHMSRPCIVKQPQIPFQRPVWLTDVTLFLPALLLASILTSKGTAHLFHWILEPYWVKYWIEAGCKDFMDHYEKVKPHLPSSGFSLIPVPRTSQY